MYAYVRFEYKFGAWISSARPSPPYTHLHSIRNTRYPPALDPEHAVNEPQLIGQSLRILVVDENDYNRYTLSLYLELEGYSNLESGGRREGNRSRRSADAVYMTGAAFVNSRRRYLRLHRRRH